LREKRRVRHGWMATTLLVLVTAGCPARRADVVPTDPVADRWIAAEVERRIAAEPILSAGDIRPRVEAGRVHLHGSVEGIAAWSCAIRNASLTDGVVSVVDFLVIERGPADGVCLAPRDPARNLLTAP
jgi:hypothetical protein